MGQFSSSTREGHESFAWLWALAAASILNGTGIFLFRPLLSYQLINLGASEYIGVVATAFAIIPLLAIVWMGRWSDRIGSLRYMFTLGACVSTAGMLLTLLAQGPAVVVLASAVVGTGHSLSAVASQAIVARRSSAARMGSSFGWFSAAISIGQMTGPLLTGVFLDAYSIAVAAVAAAALCASAIIPILWVADGQRPARAGAGADGGAAAKPTVRALFRTAGVPTQLFAALALLAVMDVLTVFLPLAGEELGIAPTHVGLLLATMGAGIFISRLCLTFLVPRFGSQRILTTSLVGTAVLVAVLPWTLGLLGLAVATMAVTGFFLGLGQPMTMAILALLVPPSWRGTALAVRLGANRVGMVAVPVVAGSAAAAAGAAGAIWLASGLLILSGTQNLISLHRRRRDGEAESGPG